jgi:exosome complex component RRP42
VYEDLKKDIIALLAKDIRLDGRKANQYRKVSIETGVSQNAEGSAKVKIGETEVIAGVKMEVMKPYPDTPDQGSLMVNVELSPLCNPEFESGPPDIYSIELARVTDRAIRESKTIDVKKLCITPGEKAWTVVIDVCPINDDGNLFDAIYLAAISALKTAVYPSFDGVKIDYKSKTKDRVPVSRVPISVTVFKYGENLLIDPTTDEERVYDSRLTIAVLENDNLCSLQKGGEGALDEEDIFKMIDLAIEKSKELRKHIPAK